MPVETEQRYNVVKTHNSKGDTPPDYMQDVTLQEIYAYYFNWHPTLAQTEPNEIAHWFATARGWRWEKA
jgi:hypothetical protein